MRKLRLRTLSVSSLCNQLCLRLLTQSGNGFFLWVCRSARPTLTRLGWAHSCVGAQRAGQLRSGWAAGDSLLLLRVISDCGAGRLICWQGTEAQRAGSEWGDVTFAGCFVQRGPSRFKGKLRLRLSWEELQVTAGGVGIWGWGRGTGLGCVGRQAFCRSPQEGLSDVLGWAGKVSCRVGTLQSIPTSVFYKVQFLCYKFKAH